MNEPGFIVNLTHDIDFIKKTYQYITHDLFKLRFFNISKGFYKKDPFWTFDHIMKIEERAGCRSTFFFLQETMPWRPFPLKGWNLTLGKYKFSDPPVREMIKLLDRYDWEIALHGSFKSFRDKELLNSEKSDLENALEKKVYGVRQHFLNLDIPDTWQIQKEIGFSYDASLGQKRGVGFYNNYYKPLINKETGMLVIPLTIMDTYLSLITRGDIDKAWELTLKLINEAEENNAVLSVLWHNNFFNENDHPGFLKLYQKFLWECKNRKARFMTSYQVYEMFSAPKKKVELFNAGSGKI